MDSDLVEPRIALLNENKTFINALVDNLETKSSVKQEIKRNMYRQLLSGDHYAAEKEGIIPDRKRIQDMYAIETRVDLLSGLHAKKAILASFLHEVLRRDIPLTYASLRALN